MRSTLTGGRKKTGAATAVANGLAGSEASIGHALRACQSWDSECEFISGVTRGTVARRNEYLAFGLQSDEADASQIQDPKNPKRQRGRGL